MPAAATCASSTGPGIPPPASVPGGIAGYHAAWYGQSGYMRLCAGDRATAVVAYRNSGSLGWYQGVMGRAAYLGTWAGEPGQDQPSVLGGDGQRGSPNTGWPRYDRVASQPHAYVGPGQIAWFQFTVQAPAAPGTYRLGIRPLVEGATWMEDAGVFWEVTVLNADGSVPAASPGPRAGLYFEVTGAVPASDIHEVHAGVERSGGYLASAVGGDRSRRAVVRITTGDGTERFCCITQGPTFDIVTSNQAWSAPSAAAADTWTASTERTELAAHEYVHLWQYELGGSACMVGLHEAAADLRALRDAALARVDVAVGREPVRGRVSRGRPSPRGERPAPAAHVVRARRGGGGLARGVHDRVRRDARLLLFALRGVPRGVRPLGSAARRRARPRRYTSGMKTAVSLADDLFKQADRLARRQRKSRSRLYSDAITEYVARHDPDWITEKLNEVAESVDTSLDPFVAASAYEVLKRSR